MSEQPNKSNEHSNTNNNNNVSNTLYNYSFVIRFIITVISLLKNHVLFLLLILFYFNVHLESQTYNFDYFGITHLNKNPHFTLFSITDCRFSPIWLCIVNIIILFVLFSQEVIFTNKNIINQSS